MFTKFYLDNFEGPLELLIHLIQKDEMDVCAVSLKTVTKQLFLSLEPLKELDTGAELLGLISTLLVMKSRKLLPHEVQQDEEEYGEEVRHQIFQQLIEYCRIRETATLLARREDRERSFFFRAPHAEAINEIDYLEDIKIEEFKKIFSALRERTQNNPQQIIQADIWQVASLLNTLKNRITQESKLDFEIIFAKHKCKEELIVTFLALLELMKEQIVQIVIEKESIYIIPHESRT